MGVRLWTALLIVAMCCSCTTGRTDAPLVGVESQPFWVEAPIPGDPSPIEAHIPATGAVVSSDTVRLQPPAISAGPRRVALQVGHWRVEDAPDEFPSLPFQLGASIAGVDEVTVNLNIAERVAKLLRAEDITVDLLPATIPPSYVADAFVSLHADDDGEGTATGFKLAHGFYRGSYEDALVDALTDAYAETTGLPLDDQISEAMTDYYAFAWFRYEHALAPHTPAAIIEMGYLSNDRDRALLTQEPDLAATGIANGILRFLAANPRRALFATDIVVPTVREKEPPREKAR